MAGADQTRSDFSQAGEELCSRVNVELAVDRLQVVPDRVRADAELLSDGDRVPPLDQVPQHVPFARGQDVELCRRDEVIDLLVLLERDVRVVADQRTQLSVLEVPQDLSVDQAAEPVSLLLPEMPRDTISPPAGCMP